MALLQQFAFALMTGLSVWLFAGRVSAIRRNILLGRDEDMGDRKAERFRNLLLQALGQRRMFRNPLAALLHLVIYAGFIIINVEVLEIVLDGLLGTHRLFAPLLGALYPWLIGVFEVLAAGVILVCLVFLARRNLLSIGRFRSPDLDGWPRRDANIILVAEVVLMGLFLTMNASDTLLQVRGHAHYAAHPTGDLPVSALLHPLLAGLSDGSLVAVERACWWLHIAGILAFLNYLPRSKHLHILLAFPNAWYVRLSPAGRMTNMPDVQREVGYALDPMLAAAAPPTDATPQRFGARDVTDLSWKNLMDAYSCTECGRCTAACPASQTGKKLSPRRIMMATRDRLEEVGIGIDKTGGPVDDGRSLLRDHISEEELRACTTCNACVTECPVGISPLDIILQMRRYMVMEEGSAPQEWTMMFGNVENSFAPWKIGGEERETWADG
jgi:ferredoxin